LLSSERACGDRQTPVAELLQQFDLFRKGKLGQTPARLPFAFQYSAKPIAHSLPSQKSIAELLPFFNQTVPGENLIQFFGIKDAAFDELQDTAEILGATRLRYIIHIREIRDIRVCFYLDTDFADQR
jgi:hypothetical protein